MAKYEAPSPEYHGPPKNHGGSGNKPIKRVTMHCTAGAEPGVKGAARAIARYFHITDRYASAHYAADSLESVQCAWDAIICYHAPPNKGSIGYELCCSLANEGKGHWENAAHQAMLRIAAKDVAQLCLHFDLPIRKVGAIGLRLGRKGICGHNDVRDAWRQTDHWDPGPHFPWKQFIGMVKAEARKIKAGGTPQPTRVSKAHQDIADALAKLDAAIEKSGRRGPVKKARRKIVAAKKILPKR